MPMPLPEPLVHAFTPSDKPTSLELLESLKARLLDMPIDTAPELHAFLAAWDEFTAWIDEHLTRSRVATQVDTADEEAKAHWMFLVQEILPHLSLWHDELGRKLLDSKALGALEETDFSPFVKQIRNEVELFRAENIPLALEVEQLTNRYYETSGQWLVEFEGEKYPMPAMTRFLSDKDRSVREKAWVASRSTIAATSDAMEDLFEQMFSLRLQIAANADRPDFRDYMFRSKQRDYTPADCEALHELISTEVVPLVKELAEDQQAKLGVDTFRPWDAGADPGGHDPLRPFETADELQDGVEKMMRRLNPELGAHFAEIRPHMDLASRPNKAPGGFMTWLPWSQRPFIFANASGVHGDIVTLLHEAGHAFHNIRATARRPMQDTSTPMEFNEVASMAMELLHYDTLDVFYDEASRERAIKEHLRRIPRLLTSVARGDAFQHWMYTHPEHTRAERRAKWVELDDLYAGFVDWEGIDVDRGDGYHQILHFFVVPFYFVEYGFAQLGALQVATNAERDAEGALRAYKEALELGPQADVKGLYAKAGAQFVPTREKLHELMNWIRRQLLDG